jgi:hypothetical protein
MLRDAVERRQRFEAAHPDVTITVPGTRSGWGALERIWPPDELGMELRAGWGAWSAR